ncbi:MAG: PfkB family carbohydrate kinase [Opitutales bacterium]|jgi:sulfofructose kinase|nr:PfkB family carbohydrate kinase [Opitutales bacterium]MDP4644602.1 PfkB family carbohydrate kinase [Opitutales bacterium]MDP4883178.1 PfkB family carbohydrate kinase [Opitutales bacterium]
MPKKDAKPVVDVLCVGFACVDLNFNTDHHPAADEKLRATAMHTCGGGPAANAAVAIARLDGSARFCGYLGNDAFGDAHIREFEHDGVLADSLSRGEAPTPVATVIVKPDGCRANISYRSTQAISPVDALNFADYPAKVLLVDGHQPLLSLALIEEARRVGIPSILDAGSVSDGTMMLFNQVDYLVTSEKFARDYTGEDDPRTALAALDGSAPFIAITWGAGGVYWQDEYGQHHTPAFDIEAVDTNGAGDAFHGAFALGIAQGLKPKDNIRRANAAGALTCLKVGARSALPALGAVNRLCGLN